MNPCPVYANVARRHKSIALRQAARKYLRTLSDRDRRARENASVEALLIEGLDSGPSTPVTSEDWDEMEREGQRIIAARKVHKSR
jgi:hypothetical protein